MIYLVLHCVGLLYVSRGVCLSAAMLFPAWCSFLPHNDYGIRLLVQLIWRGWALSHADSHTMKYYAQKMHQIQ